MQVSSLGAFGHFLDTQTALASNLSGLAHPSNAVLILISGTVHHDVLPHLGLASPAQNSDDRSHAALATSSWPRPQRAVRFVHDLHRVHFGLKVPGIRRLSVPRGHVLAFDHLAERCLVDRRGRKGGGR